MDLLKLRWKYTLEIDELTKKINTIHNTYRTRLELPEIKNKLETLKGQKAHLKEKRNFINCLCKSMCSVKIISDVISDLLDQNIESNEEAEQNP